MVDLRFRAEYFKKHNEAWDGFSQDLTNHKSRFVAAKPQGASLAATFLLEWMQSYRKTEANIENDLYSKGVDATLQVGDKLEESCRNYLAVEAENQAEADAILAEVGY